MVYLDSKKYRINNFGKRYITYSVSCPTCNKVRERTKSSIAKMRNFYCKHCIQKTEEQRDLRRGIIPSNAQIKCQIPCEWCAKELLRKRRSLTKHDHVWCNTSCQVKWQNANTRFNKGSLNPGYVHGERVDGRLPSYGEAFNTDLKRRIKIRDNFQCQKCNEKLSGYRSKSLDVHHIDHNKNNNEESNLISLCKRCHRLTHWDASRKEKSASSSVQVYVRV